ncbi:MAG: hypothetical protein JSU86_16270 [Phycisphaerales bacterium]|nr:MAG: hypothetical protein JSU86_16270 [Phycisphaerales bacterium]
MIRKGIVRLWNGYASRQVLACVAGLFAGAALWGFGILAAGLYCTLTGRHGEECWTPMMLSFLIGGCLSVVIGSVVTGLLLRIDTKHPRLETLLTAPGVLVCIFIAAAGALTSNPNRDWGEMGAALVLFAVPSWLAVFVAHLLSCRRHRSAHGLCRRCGYNLTGNVSGICPECGTKIAKI